MKTKVKLIIAVMAMLAITLSGCKPKPVIRLDPSVKTNLVANSLTKTSATVNGIISGGNQVIVERGVYYAPLGTNIQSGTKLNVGSGAGSFSAHLKNLKHNTKYRVKAYAVTEQTGLILSSNTVELWTYAINDIDGNYYHTVIIGEQTWTVENLKVSHYRDGSLIPLGPDNNIAWSQLSTGARCYYNNNQANDSIYGLLYNWYAVNDKRGLAIKGWHIPSLNEWKELATYLSTNTGGKLKESGTAHWQTPNTGATNSSGFSALPAGDRGDTYSGKKGDFHDLHTDAAFWSSTQAPGGSFLVDVSYNSNQLTVISSPQNTGLSIRLVKNR